MNLDRTGRRNFLQMVTTLGAGATIASALKPRLINAAESPTYDPSARFEVDVRDVEFRVNAAGRHLMARIYQPAGTGPFPVILDLHGGGWNLRDRTAEEPMDRALAESGLLVVAIDITRASEAPYPADVQDANYAIRWLKWKAASWNGDASIMGIYGSSSGGHTAQLLGMRQHDPRYNAIPLPEAPDIDATVDYIAMRSPISDTFARYQQAIKLNREELVEFSKIYFDPWETIHEASPQEILDRGEDVSLVPMLLIQGELDDNMLPAVQQKFANTYNAAGGNCHLEVFENSSHRWTSEEGPQTERAREMVRQFVARQLD